MPISKKRFEELLINIQYDLYRKEELKLSNHELNDEQIIELSAAVLKNSYIKQIDVSHNKFGDAGAEALANLHLQKLNVSYNQIGTKGETLLSSGKIVLLSLSDDIFNYYSDYSDTENENEPSFRQLKKEFEKLLKQIMGSCYDKDAIDLGVHGFRDEQILKLVSAIKTKTPCINNIKRIYLWNNILGDQSAIALSQLCLEELDVSYNRIGVAGATALAQAKIESLNLSGNPIQDEGTKLFSNNEYIRKLSLAECDLGDDGAKAVLRNKKLIYLDLFSNRIYDEGVEEISIESSSLIELVMNQNYITSIGAKRIAKSKTIKVLDLGTNSIEDEGLASFIENDNLVTLNVSQNGITKKGFCEICKSKSLKEIILFGNAIEFDEEDSLPQNSSFQKINLSCNRLDNIYLCESVLRSLASIPTLRELDLCGNNINPEGVVMLLFRDKPELFAKLIFS